VQEKKERLFSIHVANDKIITVPGRILSLEYVNIEDYSYQEQHFKILYLGYVSGSATILTDLDPVPDPAYYLIIRCLL
jgi:hypothetical protein